jgi:hypothetical protein
LEVTVASYALSVDTTGWATPSGQMVKYHSGADGTTVAFRT